MRIIQWTGREQFTTTSSDDQNHELIKKIETEDQIWAIRKESKSLEVLAQLENAELQGRTS